MTDKKPSDTVKETLPPPPAIPVKEINGFQDAGLQEPTRYGDWDVKGRCSDF